MEPLPGPNLGFKSNFVFQCLIFGIRDIWEQSNQSNCINKLPWQLRYNWHSASPRKVLKAKSYKALKKAKIILDASPLVFLLKITENKYIYNNIYNNIYIYLHQSIMM